MEVLYAQKGDYVSIFDADFQPKRDFLNRIVLFPIHRPKIALVQVRWDFGKYFIFVLSLQQKVSLLTLNY
jgi:xyloglucan glycosyltransferase 4